MKSLENNAVSLRGLAILAVVFALVSPAPVSAATECPVRAMYGAYVGGRCVWFTKDEGAPYSKAGCTAGEENNYGISLTFSCPAELIKMYEDKKAAEQQKVLDQQEEAKRLADEELDRKIQEAVEAKLKQQEEVRNDQVVPTQAPVITAPTAVPTVSPQPTKPSVSAEVITKTPSISIPTTEVQEENLDNPTVSESAPAEVAPSTEKKPSLWTHFSGFLNRLNPFSWFK